MDEIKRLDSGRLFKAISKLEHLKAKLDMEVAPSPQLYYDWERELLELSTMISVEQLLITQRKILMDSAFSRKYNEYKLSKEKCTNVEAEKAVELQLLDSSTELRMDEAALTGIQRQYLAYRSFSENVLKGYLIREMADNKRLDTIQKAESIGAITDEMI